MYPKPPNAARSKLRHLRGMKCRRARFFGLRNRSLEEKGEDEEGEKICGKGYTADMFCPGAQKVVDIESKRSLK